MVDRQTAAILAHELAAECLTRADRHRERAEVCSRHLRESLDAVVHVPADSALCDSLRAAQAEHEAAEASLRFIACWLASGEEYALDATLPEPGGSLGAS